MRSRTTVALETQFRDKPDDEKVQSAFVQTLMDVEGYTTEEAGAYARLVQLLGRREQRHRKAHELMQPSNPDSRPVMTKVLAALKDQVPDNAIVDIVPGTYPPTFSNKDQVASDPERRASVRVGADWLLNAHQEQPAEGKHEEKKPKPDDTKKR